MAVVCVLKDDPDAALEEDAMEFRLTYEGALLADNNRGGQMAGRAKHKHEIRQKFHLQLRRAWDTNPVLHGRQFVGPQLMALSHTGDMLPHDIPALTQRFGMFGYRFVPMATRNLGLWIGLDILFLRTDAPGAVVHAGDIDNRVKTLLDALRLPHDASELGPYQSPGADEDPFFVLLEDDSLIARLSVETDTLLEPIKGDASDARVVIKITARPYRTNIANLQFA